MIRATGAMAQANPVRWSSKYSDEESGMVAYPFRIYRPASGYFLSRDPISETGGANLYALCDNDPVNKADPLGMDGLSIPGLPSLPEWPKLPSMPTLPNVTINLTPTRVGKHTIKICNLPKSKSLKEWADVVYADMEVFRYFNERNNSVVVIEPGYIAKFQPRWFSSSPNVPYFAPVFVVFGGNDYWAPVQLSSDKGARVLTGTTLPGHMLIGTRTWSVAPEGCSCLILKTVGSERSANVLDEAARDFAGGNAAQKEVWQIYFENIADIYKDLGATAELIE